MDSQTRLAESDRLKPRSQQYGHLKGFEYHNTTRASRILILVEQFLCMAKAVRCYREVSLTEK